MSRTGDREIGVVSGRGGMYVIHTHGQRGKGGNLSSLPTLECLAYGISNLAILVILSYLLHEYQWMFTNWFLTVLE